jgi:glycosyltransferase involved in cell wall biosynthesis
MNELDVISYGFANHLLDQAAILSQSIQNYRAVMPSYFPTSLVKKITSVSPKLGQRLAYRTHHQLNPHFVKTYPIELGYQLLAKLKRQSFSYFSAHDRMAARILRDFSPPKVLIAIDTGAESLFRAWQANAFCVLDLSIAIPQYRIHIYNQAKLEQWNSSVHFHYPCKWELERYSAEIAMADLILCPSQFVWDSCRFAGVEENRLRLLPYGFNSDIFNSFGRSQSVTESFKIAFVGSFCYRKGSHILLEAFHKLIQNHSNLELHIFGKIIDEPNPKTSKLFIHGHVPQSTLAKELLHMDVLAFPTLFEGSSLAVYQALACGLPVVTTTNCGSIVNEFCGVLLDEISPVALYETLEKLYFDKLRLQAMSVAATQIASRYTWQNYGSNLMQILEDAVPSLVVQKNI